MSEQNLPVKIGENGTDKRVTSKELFTANVPLQNFITGVLSRPVPETDTRKNKMAGNSDYIPISFVETKLDEAFFGLWETSNFQTKVVANEIVGSIELRVFHPVAKVWLTRTGAGSVTIQQNTWQVDEYGNYILDEKKNKIKAPKPKPSDVDAKILNTLVRDYPHLKAECIKNAAKSFGKWFGRDLNRNDIDHYEGVLGPVSNSAKMPGMSDIHFKAFLSRIEKEGTHLIADAKEVFTFNSDQIFELNEIERNGN